MDLSLDRNQLFALLGAFEDDLRGIIRNHLVHQFGTEDLLGPAHERALDRLVKDSDGARAEADIFDYLDLGDEVDILNRCRECLPATTADFLRDFATALPPLIGIRNRVVHRRPLLPDDLQTAQSTLSAVSSLDPAFTALRNYISLLRKQPDYSPTPVGLIGDAVLHNLPMPDFDDTGLIGRRRDVERLTRLIRSQAESRTPLVSVVGPGGVGKTALAVQALYDLVADLSCPYELVSWVSLKAERLTENGIIAIRDSVLSIEDAVPRFVSQLQPHFDGDVAALSEALQGIRSLIVIDNLETITGREVLDFVDSLPPTTSYLLTSRIGIGELERRFPVDPLEKRYAVDLLRRTARARGVEYLAVLPDQDAQAMVNEIGTLPLAIRWFVGAVANGREPAAVLSHKDDLINFCVENVYESLSEESRSIAQALFLIGRPVTAQDIHLYLRDLDPDQLRASLQELDRRMLVARSLVPGTLVEVFSCSEIASTFLHMKGVRGSARAEQIRQVDTALRAEEERHRLDAEWDPLRPNIIRGGTEHRASILQLRDALLKSRHDLYDDATGILLTAEALDPEFWEIFRVRGFILSQCGRIDEATRAYERALTLAPDEHERAIVSYYFAGHLSRRAHESERAVEMARYAHEILDEDATALEYGKALMFIREYDLAINLLDRASGSPNSRRRVIAVTLLVECLRRRAEVESKQRQPHIAVETLKKALSVAEWGLTTAGQDSRLQQSLLACVSELLKLAYFLPYSSEMATVVEWSIELLAPYVPMLADSDQYGYLASHARRLPRHAPEYAALVGRLGLDTSSQDQPQDSERRSDVIWGRVKTWKRDRGYGFVTLNGGGEAFLHVSELCDQRQARMLQTGAILSCRLKQDRQGRTRACEVVVEK